MVADLLTFARAGGGGSGGGGGGGSGIALLGYVPMHFISAYVKKYTKVAVASMIMWPVAVIYCILLIAGLKGIGAIAAVGAVLGTGAGLYGWFDKILKLNKKAEKDLAIAAQGDAAWDQDKLLARCREVFMQYQQDWSNNDTSKMATYMTPGYNYHAQLMVYALQQLKRRDNVLNPVIKDAKIVQVGNATGKTKDWFTVYVQAQADDQLIDQTNNNVLLRDTNAFAEYWRFERSGDTWLLSLISQATANIYTYDAELEALAIKNKYCYSLDWGWLLLPQRGQLFGNANFGSSDINNHVIGVYRNVLIQVYNYVPRKSKEKKKNYLVAQAALPKSYGNIVVRRKRRIELTGIRGLTKVSLEWQDFNKRFEVWASDMERVTSFELLNPAYMVKLEALPFEVNIEVVDNIVYLYSAAVPVKAENYEILLEILYQAFKEMKM